MHTQNIALFYLSRKENAGIAAFQNFLDAYQAHDPGIEHKLIIICKGYSDCDYELINKMLSKIDAELIVVSDEGFDFGSYYTAVNQVEAEYACFLNSYSTPSHNCWLRLLYMAIKEKDIGLAGATGSYATLNWRLPYFEFNLRGIVFFSLQFFSRITRRLWNAKSFSFFPNPHVRTNSFIIKKEVYQDYFREISIPKTKRESCQIESGKSSLTNYVLSLRLLPVIVGANGVIYQTKEWKHSRTYCFPGQSNLLVKDNRTEQYENLTPYQKKRYEHETWGVVFSEK